MYDPIPMYDSQYYDKVARQVAEGDILGDEVFYMAPLYPYTMAIPYRLFRTESTDGGYVYNITLVRYLQGVMGALSCILAYGVASLAFDRRVGLCTGLLAAIYGVFVYYDGIIMPSSLILFLHLSALLLLLLAGKHRSPIWWLAGGITLGLCAVAHGTALLVLLGVLVWVLVGFPGEKLRTKVNWSMLILAGFIPIIALVTVRNYVVGKDFVLLTSNGGKNLYIGNNPTANGSYRFYVFDLWGSELYYYLHDIKRTPQDLPPSESSKQLVKMSLRFMRQHPGRELLLLAQKFRLFFNAIEVGINDNYYFAQRYSVVLKYLGLSFGIIAPVALTGVLFSLKQWRRHLLLLMFILAQAASFTIMFVLGRYRLVFVVCLMVFAAGQIVYWWRWFRNKQYLRIALSLIPLAVFTVWVHYPVKSFDKTRGLGQQFSQIAKNYLHQGKLEPAARAFQQAARANFDPWPQPSQRRTNCYLKLGEIYERLHDAPAAIGAYEMALDQMKQDPTNRNSAQQQLLKTRLQTLRARQNP